MNRARFRDDSSSLIRIVPPNPVVNQIHTITSFGSAIHLWHAFHPRETFFFLCSRPQANTTKPISMSVLLLWYKKRSIFFKLLLVVCIIGQLNYPLYNTYSTEPSSKTEKN